MELAEDRYALLSDIISRAIQRCLIQNCKRWERFASVNREFSQFSTSSAANSLPVYGTLLILDKSTLGSVKTAHVFWDFSSIEIGLYIWWAKYYAKELRVIGTSKAQSILFWHEGLNGVMDFTVNCQIVGHFTANSWLPSFVIKEPFLQLTFLRLSAKIFWLFYS